MSKFWQKIDGTGVEPVLIRHKRTVRTDTLTVRLFRDSNPGPSCENT
jgi:hypothetical protein